VGWKHVVSIAGLFLPLSVTGVAPNARAAEPACPGRDEYMHYCASCHGEKADGKGPVAAVLIRPPPPLTSLRKKFGTLTTDLVVFLDGTTMPRAHGTSEMPVWGKVLRAKTGDEVEAIDALWRIVHYLDCIQAEEPARGGDRTPPAP